MRKILVLFLFVVMLAACNNAQESNSNEPNNSENGTEAISEPDNAENRHNNNVSDGEYEFTYDINEITGDDRFMPLSGTIGELVEMDEVIAENDNLTITAIRRIKMVESYQAYQIQLDNNYGGEISVKIVHAEADGEDITEYTYMNLNQSLHFSADETDYLTIAAESFEVEIPPYDELKIVFEVVSLSGDTMYDVVGEHEVLFKY